ncbi:MAG: hypothetical protein K2M80_02850 [Muribaculaceae bacterium]|nr:hypothetical protein [Muribaculaceae bacterium]
MKKIAIAALTLACASAAASAQSVVDAYNLSQSDLRGTARFMSMAGAFTALGGDLSTLNQNPGGIGLFRRHELGVTVDLNMTGSNVEGEKWNSTHFSCNNFGYVGAVNTGSDIMPYFQWGVSYGRAMSFDRQYRGGFDNLGTSLTNYIANYTTQFGYSPTDLGQSTSYNPYYDSAADWLSILAYNSYMINPTTEGSNKYSGLFNEGKSSGNALFDVRERGYVDEYSIAFGGNFADIVYWGMDFGITDLNFTSETNYDEELANARIAKSEYSTGGTVNGNAYYNLNNWTNISGTGFNYKFGLIVRPIQELRFGVAIHTPTYYKLSTNYDAIVDYSYSTVAAARAPSAQTSLAYFDWRLRTPFKFMIGAAGVIGNSAIVSLDYEYSNMRDIRVSSPGGPAYEDITEDAKLYFKPSNTIRLGLEYRITPKFSARLGFSTTTSNVEKDVNNGDVQVYTSGCNPSYAFTTGTNYITAGLGYRTGGFSIDFAYVNKHQKSTYRPYTCYGDDLGWVDSPYVDFTNNSNQLVLSLGYRF